MKAKLDSGIVSRDHDMEIDVSCKYDRDGIVSGASFKPISKIKINESKLIFHYQLLFVSESTFKTEIHVMTS